MPQLPEQVALPWSGAVQAAPQLPQLSVSRLGSIQAWAQAI
jgi:hypothetical protein